MASCLHVQIQGTHALLIEHATSLIYVFSPRIRQFDADGSLTNDVRLKEMGFAPGDHVQRKQDKLVGVIEKLTAKKVTVKLGDGSVKSASADSFVNREWRVVQAKDPAVPVTWAPSAPMHSVEFTLAQVKGFVIQKLWEQAQADNPLESKLRIFQKPKGVFADAAFAVNKLKLPCHTFVVNIKQASVSSDTHLTVGTFTLQAWMKLWMFMRVALSRLKLHCCLHVLLMRP